MSYTAIPQINSNGNSKESLLNELQEASEAIRTAMEKLAACDYKHPRNYQTVNDGGVMAATARDEHYARLEALRKVQEELTEIGYAISLSEMVHSTGSIKRLSREGITDTVRFGSHKYSEEELVAEFGASMLCALCGIQREVVENSAAYIQNWLTVLKAPVAAAA